MKIKDELNNAVVDLGIQAAYKKFLKMPISPYLKNYEFTDKDLIVYVFNYNPMDDAETSLFSGDAEPMTFSIAKVLASGPESLYKPGDFVKLKDYDTATIQNPVYKSWQAAVAKRPVGTETNTKEPPKSINNLLYSNQDKIFVLNPIKSVNDKDDYFTFRLHDGYVVSKIVDPNAFISF